MNPHTIRDSAEARRFLLQGLWWQRVHPPTAASVRQILQWLKELSNDNQPLPPTGFLADLGHLAVGEDQDVRVGRDAISVPHLPMNLVRTYEDHVLGKIIADWSFTRGADALRRYSRGREQGRGLAYLVNQFRERAQFPGVEMSPGVVTAVLESQPEEVLGEGYESLRGDGLHPLLPEMYEGLIAASRRTAEILAPEDLFELESKTALEDYSQRLAHRQVLKAGSSLEATLPKGRLKPLARRMEVPTRILDEDAYPVGGFTSLSNRGSVESMLHSQLAYMETDPDQRPDLFDTLFLLDELLYYARDENQFLRRRRTFVLALAPDLVEARFKDADLPYQRGVMLLGLLHVLIKKVMEWLSTDALTFQILFLGKAEDKSLADELGLLETLLRDHIEHDFVHIGHTTAEKLTSQCESWSRRSMVHALVCGINPPVVLADDTAVTRLALQGPRPALADGAADLAVVEGDDALEGWANTLQQILGRWV